MLLRKKMRQLKKPYPNKDLMKTSNKIFIVIFCLLTAAITAIVATAIDSVINDTKLLSDKTKTQLSWFAQRIDFSNKLVIILYITAMIFIVITIITLLAIAADKKSSRDIEFTKDILD